MVSCETMAVLAAGCACATRASAARQAPRARYASECLFIFFRDVHRRMLCKGGRRMEGGRRVGRHGCEYSTDLLYKSGKDRMGWTCVGGIDVASNPLFMPHICSLQPCGRDRKVFIGLLPSHDAYCRHRTRTGGGPGGLLWAVWLVRVAILFCWQHGPAAGMGERGLELDEVACRTCWLVGRGHRLVLCNHSVLGRKRDGEKPSGGGVGFGWSAM